VARAFQDALIETLIEKTARAARAHARARVVLGGGVAANRTLVGALEARLAADGVRVYAPGIRLATDNAAMIARAGLHRLLRGERAGPDLTAHAVRPLPDLAA
jgi:N6-L-threonylcarbamoyladenine synthase